MQRAQPFILALLLAAACGDDGDVAAPDNQAPVAQFTAVCTGLTCTFTESSTDDGTIAGRSWNFGDQTAASTEANPAHTFASAGTYQVTLTVTDDESATDDETKSVTATAAVVTAVGPFVLTQAAGFKATLSEATDCEVTGNTFRIKTPLNSVLTANACFDPGGTQITHAGPYAAGTPITAEITSPTLQGTPQLQITGAYPEWTIRFEDGADTDFDDLVVTLTALP